MIFAYRTIWAYFSSERQGCAVAIFGIAVAAVIGLMIIWLMFTYNRFVAKQKKIDIVWDEVDEHLRLRHELVPSLLYIAGTHMQDEASVFKQIEDVNNMVHDDMEDREAAPLENELSNLLRHLRGEAGKYPDLMLDQKFITTLGELVSMEGKAASACDRHNALVREYNTSIKSFPANIIAGALQFDSCEMRIFGS